MPSLSSLDAHFVVDVPPNADSPNGGMRDVDGLDGAQGVRLECPLGHGHWIVVWFNNPRGIGPAPANVTPVRRWAASGSSIQDLSLSPSINLDNSCTPKCPQGLCPEHGCRWHGWVTNGNAQ